MSLPASGSVKVYLRPALLLIFVVMLPGTASTTMSSDSSGSSSDFTGTKISPSPKPAVPPRPTLQDRLAVCASNYDLCYGIIDKLRKEGSIKSVIEFVGKVGDCDQAKNACINWAKIHGD